MGVVHFQPTRNHTVISRRVFPTLTFRNRCSLGHDANSRCSVPMQNGEQAGREAGFSRATLAPFSLILLQPLDCRQVPIDASCSCTQRTSPAAYENKSIKSPSRPSPGMIGLPLLSHAFDNRSMSSDPQEKCSTTSKSPEQNIRFKSLVDRPSDKLRTPRRWKLSTTLITGATPTVRADPPGGAISEAPRAYGKIVMRASFPGAWPARVFDVFPRGKTSYVAAQQN